MSLVRIHCGFHLLLVFEFWCHLQIMRDPETGNSRGFGFISYDSFEASDAAIEVNLFYLMLCLCWLRALSWISLSSSTINNWVRLIEWGHWLVISYMKHVFFLLSRKASNLWNNNFIRWKLRVLETENLKCFRHTCFHDETSSQGMSILFYHIHHYYRMVENIIV